MILFFNVFLIYFLHHDVVQPCTRQCSVSNKRSHSLTDNGLSGIFMVPAFSTTFYHIFSTFLDQLSFVIFSSFPDLQESCLGMRKKHKGTQYSAHFPLTTKPLHYGDVTTLIADSIWIAFKTKTKDHPQGQGHGLTSLRWWWRWWRWWWQRWPTSFSYRSSTSAYLVFRTALTDSRVLMFWNMRAVSSATSADLTVLNTSSMNLRMSNSTMATYIYVRLLCIAVTRKFATGYTNNQA